MQNNYPAFHRFDSQFQPQQNDNLINKFKLKFQNSNKKMLFAGIIVVLAGISVGGILKMRSLNTTSSIPSGEVAGVLTQASFTPSPTQTPGPTNNPNSTPEEFATPEPLDPTAEGASATTSPTSTPSPTGSPTPTPTSASTYTASMSISNSPAAADGNSQITIVVAVTKNGTSDCGETVYLISDKAGVSFSSDSCSAGNNTFTATSTTAQTYTITPEVYGVPYATSTITFN